MVTRFDSSALSPCPCRATCVYMLYTEAHKFTSITQTLTISFKPFSYRHVTHTVKDAFKVCLQPLSSQVTTCEVNLSDEISSIHEKVNPFNSELRSALNIVALAETEKKSKIKVMPWKKWANTSAWEGAPQSWAKVEEKQINNPLRDPYKPPQCQ